MRPAVLQGWTADPDLGEAHAQLGQAALLSYLADIDQLIAISGI